MAFDLKLEIFASKLFQTFWRKQEFFSQSFEASSMYRDEYHLISQNEEVYKESYFKAVFIRCQLFCQVFQKEINENFSQLESSAVYISDYIFTMCERDDLFGNLTIFERLFSTCAFVVHLGNFCYKIKGYKDVISYAHLCWAIYFDKYREDFYRLGGWNQLSVVSVSYVLPYDLLSVCKAMVAKDEYFFLFKMIEAMDSYKNFVLSAHFDYETISKAWIRFHLLKLNRFDDGDGIMNKKEQSMRDSKEVEKVLTHLKRFCDPCGLETLREMTKIPTDFTHSVNSEVIHPVKNTKHTFVKENTLCEIIRVDEHSVENGRNFTCDLEHAPFLSQKKEVNDQKVNELFISPREREIQQLVAIVDGDKSVLECPSKNAHIQPETFGRNISFENKISEEYFPEASGLDIVLKSTPNKEHLEANSKKCKNPDGSHLKTENLQTRYSLRISSPHFFQDPITQNDEIHKYCTETVFKTQLKQANLILIDTTEDSSSNTKTKQTEIYLKENDYKTNAMTTKDLSGNEEFPIISNRNDAFGNSLHLIPQKPLSEGSGNKTQTTSEQKINKVQKEETDLERKSPEVKCLLRLILVLGNPKGIVNVRSSLKCLDKRR